MAQQYLDSGPDGATSVSVLVPLGDGTTLKMSGAGERFGVILNTVTSDTDNSEPAEDAMACIQVIVYAQERSGSQCQQFSTPCDVPDGWLSCEPE